MGAHRTTSVGGGVYQGGAPEVAAPMAPVIDDDFGLLVAAITGARPVSSEAPEVADSTAIRGCPSRSRALLAT